MAHAPRAVRRRPKRLPRPVQELLGSSLHLAPTREVGHRRWLSASGPRRRPQRGGRGWAKRWRISASRLRVAVYRGNQRGTIPAKPAQACGYSPTTTGGPSKTGGHRIDLKPATGKQLLKAKPDPPELPKDAYSNDFPSLSKREAANRWRGGAARGPSCAPPKVGGSLPCLSSAAGPPPKGAAPCAKGPKVNAPVVSGTPVPKAAGADAPNDGGSGGCAPANSEITRREGQLRVSRLVCLSRQSLTRRSRHLSVGTAFQMSLVGRTPTRREHSVPVARCVDGDGFPSQGLQTRQTARTRGGRRG